MKGCASNNAFSEGVIVVDYMPAVNVKTMNRLAGGPFGEKHTAVLYDKIESLGMVQYEFLLIVFDNEKEEPVYFVASEKNALWSTEGGGSHFLGVFTEAGHANLGSCDDWGDPRKFFPKAISLAAEHFGVSLEGEESNNGRKRGHCS